MAITIKRAIKHESKLRMALAGPSGSGKTYTSLILASSLAGDKGIIVIDTERGSAAKYADLFTFDTIELDTFSPENYIDAIHVAEQAGYDVLIIDSLSHEWNGAGGMLEIVDTIAKRNKAGNTFTAWGEATPRHNRLVDAITRANMHVIVTMRSKQDYVIEKDERTGKSIPRKVGMAPIQRDGFEYETDVFCDLDMENTLIVQKSRCPALSGAVIAKPDAKVAEVLKAWLSGAPAPAKEPSYLDVYEAGKAKKLWLDVPGFCAFATAELGVNITKESARQLNADLLLQLDKAVEQEQAA